MKSKNLSRLVGAVVLSVSFIGIGGGSTQAYFSACYAEAKKIFVATGDGEFASAYYRACKAVL